MPLDRIRTKLSVTSHHDHVVLGDVLSAESPNGVGSSQAGGL